MLHSKFSRLKLLTTAWFFVFALLLTSCITPNEEKEEDKTEEVLLSKSDAADLPIYGSWESAWGEVFEITTTEFKNYYGTAETYAGDNLRVQKTSDNSGYIYFKYTKSALPDYSAYTEDAPDVGNWYVVLYKDLTENTVFLAGAYKADGKTSCKKLKDAINEFTVENGYFAGGSECTRKGSASAGNNDNQDDDQGSGYENEQTIKYYVRRSYSDPSDSTYTNMLTDDTYWDILVIDEKDKTSFKEVTYPVNAKNRVREEFIWKSEGQYYYLYDEDDEKTNGAIVTFTDNKITRKTALGIDYMEYLSMMFVEENFELVTDISKIPVEDSYPVPVEKTLADCVGSGSYCVPGWCQNPTSYSLLLITPDKKAMWYYYANGSRYRKEYNLSNYSTTGTVITEDDLAIEFSPQVDDDTCQIRFKNNAGTWSSWHLTPYADCGVIELKNENNDTDFLCLTKFGAFGFVKSSRDMAWSAKSKNGLGCLNACSDNGTSTIRITSDKVYVSLWEEDDYDEESEEAYGKWTVTSNSNISISDLFSMLQ